MVGMIIEGNDQSINVGRLFRSDSSSQRPTDNTGSVSIPSSLSWMNIMAAFTADAWIALIAYLSASL